MLKIKLEGLDKLQKALKENVTMDDVKKVVKNNGSALHRKTKRNADFTKGYQTGTTKQSIGLEIVDGGFAAEVEPTTEYASYVEYGTRFMDAQPFVGPAFNEQAAKFKRDMERLTR